MCLLPCGLMLRPSCWNHRHIVIRKVWLSPFLSHWHQMSKYHPLNSWCHQCNTGHFKDGNLCRSTDNFMELSVCFFALGIPASCNCIQWRGFHFFDLLALVSSIKRFRGTVYTGWHLSICGFGHTRLFFSSSVTWITFSFTDL